MIGKIGVEIAGAGKLLRMLCRQSGKGTNALQAFSNWQLVET